MPCVPCLLYPEDIHAEKLNDADRCWTPLIKLYFSFCKGVAMETRAQEVAKPCVKLTRGCVHSVTLDDLGI